MFDSELSIALAGAMLAAGLNDPKKQRDFDGLVTPRTEIKIVLNSSIAPNAQAPHQWIRQSDGTKWTDVRTGTLTFKNVTRRGANQDHAGMDATCTYIINSQRPDISSRMEWHSLAHIHEIGRVPQFESDKHHDVSSITAAITLRIKFPEKESDIFLES